MQIAYCFYLLVLSLTHHIALFRMSILVGCSQEPSTLTEVVPLTKRKCDAKLLIEEQWAIVEHIARETDKVDTVRGLALHANSLI